MFLFVKLLLLGICVCNVRSTLEVELDRKQTSSEGEKPQQEEHVDSGNKSEDQHGHNSDNNHQNLTTYQTTLKSNTYDDGEDYDDDGIRMNNENYDVNKNPTSVFNFTEELTTLPDIKPDNENKTEVQQGESTPRKEQPPVASPKGIINYNKHTLPSCPHGFTNHNEEGLFGMCSFITKPAAFPPKCPYPDTINVYPDFLFVLNATVWLPAKRNTSDGLGPFEWVKTTQPYTNLELHNREQEKGITEKNCLVFNTEEEKPVPTNCSDKYPAFCFYNYHNPRTPFSAFDHYCRRRYNEFCVSNELSFPMKCYCKSSSQAEKQPRKTFCKKLVEIEEPSANNLLVNLLHDNESCWIGLHEGRSSYQWASTNTTTNYTFWSNDVDFRKTYGALSRNGWLLEADGALSCAVCEIEVKDHPQIRLHIKHNRTSNMLQVEIKNALEVHENVTCFKDNFKNYITRDLFDNTENYLIIDMELPFNTTGYCWCVALQIPDLIPVYSNTILVANTSITYGHEFAVSTTFHQNKNPPFDRADEQACESITSNLSEIVSFTRPVKIIDEEKENTAVLCHFNTKPSELSITQEFQTLSNLLKNTSANATSLASIQVCLPSVTTSGTQTLNWPETPIGATTIPEELCVQQNGVPVTRTCAGNFYYGSHWLDVNGSCADVTYSPNTLLLNHLLKSKEPTPSMLDESLLNVTKDTKDFTSLDIYLVSKIFEKLAGLAERISVDHIAKVVDNVMHIDGDQLKASQEILNSTDTVLYSLDDMLATTKVNDSGSERAVTEKLVVHISDLKKTDVIGIKLGKGEAQKGFDSSTIGSLHHGVSEKDLQKESFDLAMIIPQQLRNDIVNCMSPGPHSSSNLITTVFYDDVLFGDQQNTSNHPDGRIIGVTLPGFGCSFNTPLQVIFKPSTNNTTQLKCASWLYGFNERMESIHGRWFIEGDPKTFGNTTYQVCEFTHVTHFTLLLLGGSNTISPGHKKALDIITAVGSGLSILGLLVIFLTAIIFKSFRSDNAVVINFSIAMTAQIVLLFTADNVAKNKGLCVAFGAALHYIVLVQFLWMLTIAILQYKRYVLVFASPTTHLIAKTCAFSWGVPLIPVIVIVSISRDNYGENSNGLCYALGNYFIFGVLVPVCVILFVNLLVFLRIMLSIASSSRIKSHQKKDENPSLQLRLAIMLYFLLGLTWGFGLLAAIGGGVVYSYLFCLTATMQGFILFLYFIVLNEKTRSLWVNMKSCCRKSDDYDVARDSSGTPMVRRTRNTKTSDTNTDSTTSEMLRRLKNRSSTDF